MDDPQEMTREFSNFTRDIEPVRQIVNAPQANVRGSIFVPTTRPTEL